MAKSSRSKWKKLHRRQRAQAEQHNTVKRVSKLNKKLKLTAKGGISLVPPQDPETRFHFTNPEKNLRVPDPRREYNNDYRNNRTVIDFSKPLQLPAPKTNFYGKTDINAPHPMTQHYEVIDADAPIAGHALTKADVERAAAKAAAEALRQNEEHATVGNVQEEEEASDGPEEYVFGMEDKAPTRIKKASKKSASATIKKSRDSRDEESELADGIVTGRKIRSMEEAHKINNVVVSTTGTSKMKKVSGMSGSAASRVVSSGSAASKKKKKS